MIYYIHIETVLGSELVYITIYGSYDDQIFVQKREKYNAKSN